MALTLAAARDVVDTERRECVAEREAFERFRRAVVRLDATGDARPTGGPPQGGVGTVHAGVVGPASRDTGPTTLRRAYRRSVMAAAPETDESLGEHVAGELGPDLARVVCGGPVTPDARRALLDRVDVALEAREAFLALLERERASLEGVTEARRRGRRRLRRARAWEDESTSMGAGETVEAALSAWSRLDDVAGHLDRAARDRQMALDDHRRSLAAVDDDVTDYLYGCRPGLSAIASVGRELSTARRAVTRAVGIAEC